MNQFNNRLMEIAFTETWAEQAALAFERFCTEQSIDPIAVQRLRDGFVHGFMAAARPVVTNTGPQPCINLDLQGLLSLGHHLTQYIIAFGKHAAIAPGDMMAGLTLVATRIGRQMHPTLNNEKVFEVFEPQVKPILKALDKLETSTDQVKH